MRNMVISSVGTETWVAILEQGRAAELYLERPGQRSLVGNIYKGRVETFLPGMEAAFVDIGLGRNGFLSSSEVVEPDLKPRSRRGGRHLKAGKTVLVQVTRDAMGGKGPRLTTDLGLAGRYLVYMPLSRTTGTSRRLADGERSRLRELVRELRPEKGGLIARTAAEGAERGALERDLRFLQRQWGALVRKAARLEAPALMHQEMDLALRCVRDALSEDFTSVDVDDATVFRRVRNYLRAVAPELAERVRLHKGPAPLFETLRLDKEISRALERRVSLPSGGYLIIEQTEAMTVIDVNSGRYVGAKALEDTILRTNLEACREVVRQLRLRDIGGIIVIDFIDMASRTNREAVLALLQAELERDRTKTYVVEISPLGLVEMTRQNVTLGLRELLTVSCACCEGEGRVLSPQLALALVRRRLRQLAASSPLPILRVEVHPQVAALLDEQQSQELSGLEAETGRRLLVEPASAAVPVDHVALLPD